MIEERSIDKTDTTIIRYNNIYIKNREHLWALHTLSVNHQKL